MLRVVLAACAVLCLSTSALAEGAPAPTAPVPAPAKMALARKFMEVIRLKKTLQRMSSDLQPVLMEQERKEHPEITPDQQKVIDEVVTDSMADFTDKMLEKWVPIYANTFSEQDMQMIIDFYSSPAGQAYLDKAPQLSAAAANMMREMLPDLQKDIFARLCQRLDCFNTKPSPPPQRPS